MALLVVDWATFVIEVPQANLTLVGGTSYTYDVEDMLDDLLDRFDEADAMPFIVGYSHNTEVVVGSITYARLVQIINGYTLQFEDGEYSVEVIGGNTNLSDTLVKNNVNVFLSNSAGLISSAEITLIRKILMNRKVLSDGTTNNLIIYDDDDVTPPLTFSVTDETSSAISLGAGDPAEQSRGS